MFADQLFDRLELGRRLLGLDDSLSDSDVAKAMTFKRLQDSQTDFLPLHQHRVVAISVFLRYDEQIRLWSLGETDSDEAELIRRFFDGLEKLTPELVSWNGGGFDLPVLHYRSLRHGIAAPRYWETGDLDREFRFNNYLSRFHWRHLDLMDVLAGFNYRASAKLDEIAVMLGFPGKLGMSGSQVADTWLAGNIEEIRNYCETDVLNTYLVYLRFQQIRGILDAADLDAELDRVRELLTASDQAHLRAFNEAWSAD